MVNPNENECQLLRFSVARADSATRLPPEKALKLLDQTTGRTPAGQDPDSLGLGSAPITSHRIVIKEVGEEDQEMGIGRQDSRLPLMRGYSPADMARQINSHTFKYFRNVSKTISADHNTVHEQRPG